MCKCTWKVWISLYVLFVTFSYKNLLVCLRSW